MPFIQKKLTKSVLQTRGIFNKYIYKPDNGDTLADITAEGYFSQSRFKDDPEWVGSVIEVVAADGYYTLEIANGTVNAGFTKDSGWVQITDTTYTIGSPQAVSSGVRTKLDINADSVIQIQAPAGTTAETFYNSTSKKLFGQESGDALLFRLNMTIDPAQTNGSVDVDLDIGGSQGIIWQRTTTLAKGSNPFPYSSTNAYYTLGTFQANGGEIYITPTVNVDIYDITLVLIRLHKGV